jgi:hypothetical protein
MPILLYLLTKGKAKKRLRICVEVARATSSASRQL